ncbi:MAG: riboflavin synthase [Rubrobacteraceae bacterium]
MFTGLVETRGRVESLQTGPMTRIEVSAGPLTEGLSVGDSVSVNGTCLTVGEVRENVVTFHAMHETLRRTALGGLRVGSVVNLERAMRAGDRFGGHIVQGHVDGVGEVSGVRAEGDAEIWAFAASEEVLRYTVEKGSICVDGISLTVVCVDEVGFTVSVLPQTRSATNLGELSEGDRVNLEADVIGKYVERLLAPRLAAMKNDDRRIEDAV